MELSHAWNSAVSERWSPPAHGIPRLLSGGTFLRVEFCCFRAMDSSSARDFAFPEWWTVPARGILLFPSGGALQRARFCDSRAVDRSRAGDSAGPEVRNADRDGDRGSPVQGEPAA